MMSPAASAPAWRALDAATFLPVARAEARALGVVRPADVTGLDRVGLPCWQAFRPAAADVPGNITVFNGKGWTHQQAELGALIEGIERHWGEGPAPSAGAPPPAAQRVACIDELEREGAAFIHPSDVPLPTDLPAPPHDAPLLWVSGQSGGREVWLGAHEVYSPYLCPDGVLNPGRWRSTGLAAGSTPAEAAFYGLLEVIERDADAVAELRRNPDPDLDLESLPSPRLQQLYQRLQAEGIKYGSGPGAPANGQINTRLGGRGLYFVDPDGHLMEIMTRA